MLSFFHPFAIFWFNWINAAYVDISQRKCCVSSRCMQPEHYIISYYKMSSFSAIILYKYFFFPLERQRVFFVVVVYFIFLIITNVLCFIYLFIYFRINKECNRKPVRQNDKTLTFDMDKTWLFNIWPAITI